MAHVAGIDLRADDATAHEVDNAVDGAQEELEKARAFAAKAEAQATQDDVDNDEFESQTMQKLTKMNVDEKAGDIKYTIKMHDDNYNKKQELREELYKQNEKKTKSAIRARQAQQSLTDAKTSLADFKEKQMIAIMSLKESKNDVEKTNARASKVKEQLKNLQHRNARMKALEAKNTPNDWETSADYALDNDGHLIHVRHESVDKDGERKVYTMIDTDDGPEFATLKLDQTQATEFDPKNGELLRASVSSVPTPTDLTLPSSEAIPDDPSITPDTDQYLAHSMANTIRTSHAYHNGMPELGEGAPTQLMNDMWSKAHWAQRKSNLIGKGSAKKDSITGTLAKVSAITAILNKKVVETNAAMDNFNDGVIGGPIKRVAKWTRELNLGASNVMKLAGKAKAIDGEENSKAHTPKYGANHTDSDDDETPDKVVDGDNPWAIIKELKFKSKQQSIMMKALKAELVDSKMTQDPAVAAKKWERDQEKKANADAEKFDSKMEKVKATARRKKVLLASVADMMTTEKMVDISAKSLRMADYLSDMAAKKFAALAANRQIKSDELPRLKKLYLKYKNNFEGYGPEMDPERAQASEASRRAAAEREDAKKFYERSKAEYENAVAAEYRFYEEIEAAGIKMMHKYRNELKDQKTENDYKLKSAAEKTKMEIASRTSCKAVQEKLRIASGKCDCKMIDMWRVVLGKNDDKTENAKLKIEKKECKASLEECKFAYRKSGHVWAEAYKPKKEGAIYVVTGKAKSIVHDFRPPTPPPTVAPSPAPSNNTNPDAGNSTTPAPAPGNNNTYPDAGNSTELGDSKDTMPLDDMELSDGDIDWSTPGR